MAQVSQGQQEQSEEASLGPTAHQQLATDESTIHQELAIDTPSDNDANEKSAREKFKKTSIASLYKHTVPSETLLQSENGPGTVEALEQSVPGSEGITEEGSRGRAAGKRALEDEDISNLEHDNIAEYELQPDPSNGHTRKRSRDVRAGEHVKGNGRYDDSGNDPLQEEAEDFVTSENPEIPVGDDSRPSISNEDFVHESIAKPGDLQSVEMTVLSDPIHEAASERLKPSPGLSIKEGKKSEDEEMKDGSYSPRKKRSRDQMDAVADREQKIAATEETRAQRRSEELDRADTSVHQGPSSTKTISSNDAVTISPANISSESRTDDAKVEAPKATFGATNVLHSSSGSTASKSATKNSDGRHPETEDVSAPGASTFSSSGFANFASSSSSPFGAVGSSSSSAAPKLSTFAKPPTEAVDAEDFGSRGSSGFVPFSKASQTDFGGTKLSSFASAGSKIGSTFGGAQFGGSFGSGFGGGSKLTSFAAPTGNAKLGSANGSVKPVGSSSNDDEDKDGSNTEDEGDDDGYKNDETSEADERFQHQDVDTGEDGEDTIFSSRAKLYAFKDNNWKEAGNGVFKLNVISSKDPEDEQKSSRFIMRAHQTYRVLLNQPAFPQMKMGNQLGSEPSSKTFAFAVIVDGKPIPHMVKFGDVNESKKLYHEVIKLQQRMTKETPT